MLTKTLMRKSVALTMLVILATNTFAPGAAYALTAGPTSPEATSFEPVDTTDMVNLNTGSFTYNLPLLEVPGPEGGYPLSLSYHAGIQPDLDASWVGLGWTLNPGAINRNVNGTPDDWNGVDGTIRDYWSGGQQWNGTLGVSLGYDVVSVSAGLTFGNDTYKGFGVGGYVGVGVGFAGTPVSVGATVGVSPWGDPYGNMGLSFGGQLAGNVNGSIGLGISTNFKSIDASINTGVGWSEANPDANKGSHLNNYEGGSILGASIGTNSGKPSLDVGGVSASISNSSAGNISTAHSGLTLNIPVWYGVNVTLGYQKQRYWVNERQDFKSYGSYIEYTPDGLSSQDGNSIATNKVYDAYSVLEGGETNIVDNPDPKMQQGGSFPEFDRYDVLAQGVSGSIRPYNFQQKLYQQSWENRTEPYVQTYIYYNGQDHIVNQQPYFRFDNDFSNTYRQVDMNSSAANNYASSAYPYSGYSEPDFDQGPQYGNSDGNFGFGGGNKLAGSKSVTVGSSILPSRVDAPSSRPLLGTVPSGISGFEITNSSGVTYHFALPAYANEEESYQARKDDKSNSFNRLTRPKAYAYTWHLTTITGPDFVDRNNNSRADEGDWGYYVNFEYGLWNENYMWRNPAEGFIKDDDPTFDRLAMGQKEIYYLNAIKTRTHTALFEKEERVDGKGASNLIKTIKRSDNRSYLFPDGKFDNTSQSVLRLNKIYLFSNTMLPVINYAQSGSGSLSYMQVTVNDPVIFQPAERQITVPNYAPRKENVFDNNDLGSNRATIESMALRIIDLNYDYSLCPGASNSFYKSSPATKYGKLALTSIKMRGKGGVDLLPATKFDYNLPADEVKKASSVSVSTTSFSSSTNFEVGELIETDDAYARYLGVIVSKNGNSYTIQNNSQITTITANIRTTKNPPYNRYAYDLWQMYKSNARADLVVNNINRYGKGDDISAKAVDVWSLRGISGPYGEKIKVRYESNTFSNVLINESFPFVSGMNVTQWENNRIKRAQLNVDISGYRSISDLIDTGGVGRLVAMLKYTGDGNVANRYNAIYAEFTVEQIVSNSAINVVIHDYQQGDIATVTKKRSWIRRALNTLLGIPLIASSTEYQGCLTANISFIKKNKPYEYGGGIRVKDITLETGESSQTTSYSYHDLTDSKLSSGVTTYTPTTLPIYDEAVFSANGLAEIGKEYKKMLFRNVNELYAYSRLLPAPGVYYEYVTVSNSVVNNVDGVQRLKEGKTRYQFEVPSVYSVNRQVTVDKDWNTQISPTFSAWRVKEKHIVFRNFTSAIGNLKSTTTLDNNGKKLTESINNYLHDGLQNENEPHFFEVYRQRLQQFNYQGLLVERNFEAKGIDDAIEGQNYYRKVTYTTKETYPCIPIGTTILNYVNGTKTVSENLAFDFYSGVVTKTLNIDANGNRSMAEQTPAYRIYPEMGLKAMDAGRKNMLTQTAAGYVYSVDNSNNKIGIISASVNTWSTGINVLKPDHSIITQDGTNSTNGIVWRPRMTYTWAPEGSTQNGETAIGVFVAFDWANQDNPAAQNASWIKSSETTLYDVYSHALEAADMNDQYAATKMGYNHSKVLVTGGPARYAEIAYSGVEDDPVNGAFNGDIKLNQATVQTLAANVHTGTKSAQLSSGTGLEYEVPISKLDNTKDYWASLWIKSATGNAVTNAGIFYNNGSGQVNGILSPSNPSGWQLATILIPASAISGAVLTVGGYSNGGTVYLDDIRFHPVNAGISSYVYDNVSGELTYILDNNNVSTRFEYDGVGRLTKTYKETLPQGFRPISEILYHYSKTLYQSDAIISQTFTKNDCTGTNVVGSDVSITVPQGQFTSFISKAHANQQAYAYAQQQANQQGTCNNIYVIIREENLYSFTGQNYAETYADVVMRAYKDAAHTIPYYGQVDVAYGETEYTYATDGGMNCDGGIYEINNTYPPVRFSGGEYYLATGKLVYRAKLDPYTNDVLCETMWYYWLVQ